MSKTIEGGWFVDWRPVQNPGTKEFYTAIFGADGKILADTLNSDCVLLEPDDEGRLFDREGYARAVMMAAAPDLYQVVSNMLEAIEKGGLELNSPEIGEPEVGIPMHPWHEEFLFYARAALTKATGGGG